jgi:O-antigen biosynthesis protein
MSDRGRRIFVYSSGLPRFDIQAGDRRFAELLRMLSRSHRVDLCLAVDEADPSNPALVALTDKYRRHLADGGVRLLPAGWRHVERTLIRETYDLGLFEFYYNAQDVLPLFRRLQPQARVLTDSVDVHYLRERAAADLGLIPSSKAEETRRRELAVYRESDVVIVVSELDRLTLEGEGSLPPVVVVPIIVPSRQRAEGRRENELVFIGGFDHLPNLHGLQWFVAEAWPRVREAMPGAMLTVIGSNPRPEICAMADLPGVRMLGYVPDTNPYLDQAAVSVAPLLFGSGMKGKVIEAMACGVPVVTTTVGVQGLRVVSGEHVLLADDPGEFAAAVVSLLGDPVRAREIGLSGQRYIAGVCGPEVVSRLAEEALSTARLCPRHIGPANSRTWDRARFEALRLFCLPYWGPKHLFRRHMKARIRTLRDQLLARPTG